jgi:hypothetical protein
MVGRSMGCCAVVDSMQDIDLCRQALAASSDSVSSAGCGRGRAATHRENVVAIHRLVPSSPGLLCGPRTSTRFELLFHRQSHLVAMHTLA